MENPGLITCESRLLLRAKRHEGDPASRLEREKRDAAARDARQHPWPTESRSTPA